MSTNEGSEPGGRPSSVDSSSTRGTPQADVSPAGAPWRTTPLQSFPPIEKWDDWVEYDAKAWPRKVEKRYTLVPTTCFNCEAACGLVAYVDKQTNEVRKL